VLHFRFEAAIEALLGQQGEQFTRLLNESLQEVLEAAMTELVDHAPLCQSRGGIKLAGQHPAVSYTPSAAESASSDPRAWTDAATGDRRPKCLQAEPDQCIGEARLPYWQHGWGKVGQVDDGRKPQELLC